MLERCAQGQEPLVCRLVDKPHHVLDAGAVVPTAIEDHDFAGRRKSFDVALHEHLGLLPVRWSRKRHHAEDTGADAFGERLDRSTFASGIAPLEDDDDS